MAATHLIEEPCCGISEPWELEYPENPLDSRYQKYSDLILISPQKLVIDESTNLEKLVNAILAITAMLNQNVKNSVYLACVYDTQLEKKIWDYRKQIRNIAIAITILLQNKIQPLNTANIILISFAQAENILNYCKLIYLLLKFKKNFPAEKIKAYFEECTSNTRSISSSLRQLKTNAVFTETNATRNNKIQCYLFQIRLLLGLTMFSLDPRYFSGQEELDCFLSIPYHTFLAKLKIYYQDNPGTFDQKKIELDNEIQARLPFQYILIFKYQFPQKIPPKTKIQPATVDVKTKTEADYKTFLTEQYIAKVRKIIKKDHSVREEEEWRVIYSYLWAQNKQIELDTDSKIKDIAGFSHFNDISKLAQYLLKFKNDTETKTNLGTMLDIMFEYARHLILVLQKEKIDLLKQKRYTSEANEFLDHMRDVYEGLGIKKILPTSNVDKFIKDLENLRKQIPPIKSKPKKVIPIEPQRIFTPPKTTITKKKKLPTPGEQITKNLIPCIAVVFSYTSRIKNLKDYNTIKAFIDGVIGNLDEIQKIENEKVKLNPELQPYFTLAKIITSFELVNSIVIHSKIAIAVNKDKTIFKSQLSSALKFLHQSLPQLNKIPEIVFEKITACIPGKFNQKTYAYDLFNAFIKILPALRTLIPSPESPSNMLNSFWDCLITNNDQIDKLESAKEFLNQIWQNKQFLSSQLLEEFFKSILDGKTSQPIKELIQGYLTKIDSPPKKKKHAKTSPPKLSSSKQILYPSKTPKKTPENSPATKSPTEAQKVIAEEIHEIFPFGLDSKNTSESGYSLEQSSNDSVEEKSKATIKLEEIKAAQETPLIKPTTPILAIQEPEKKDEEQKPEVTKIEAPTPPATPIKPEAITANSLFNSSHKKHKHRHEETQQQPINNTLPEVKPPVLLVPIPYTIDYAAPFFPYDIFASCYDFDHYLRMLNNSVIDFNKYFAIEKPLYLQRDIQENPTIKHWLVCQIVSLRHRFGDGYVYFLANLFIAAAVILKSKLTCENIAEALQSELLRKEITRAPIYFTDTYLAMMNQYFQSFEQFSNAMIISNSKKTP